MVDQVPEDVTIRQAADADYRYIGIDTTDLDVAGTVQRIHSAVPETTQTNGFAETYSRCRNERPLGQR